MSKPTPLRRQKSTGSPCSNFWPTSIVALIRGRVNLTAFANRFTNAIFVSAGLQFATGRSPTFHSIRGSSASGANKPSMGCGCSGGKVMTITRKALVSRSGTVPVSENRLDSEGAHKSTAMG